MPTFSIITPHWSYSPDADAMLADCHVSLGPMHERIVVVNEPAADGSVRVATHFNTGFRLSTCDFLVGVTNDTVLEVGTLAELADAAAVTSPLVNGQAAPFWGCFFCLPRAIYLAHGGWDESYTGYYEDADWFLRMRAVGVPFRSVPSVQVRHHGGRSMQRLASQWLFELNRQRFRDRWGKDELTIGDMESSCG